MGLLDRPQAAQRYGLLSPDVMSLIQSGGPRMAPAPVAPPQRQRVSGFRVLDRVLGGQTVTEGLDAERARLEAEALRPQARQRMEANRIAAAQMGPAALLAFDNNPEAFAESLGMQFRPVTTAAGSQTNYGPSPFAFRVEQPTFDTSGDQTLRRTSAGVVPVYTRTDPSIAEKTAQSVAETGRINALNVPVGPNTDLVNPVSGQPIYKGYRAPDIQNVAPGGEALVFNDGVLAGRVGSTQERPVNPALLKRADDLELALTADENSIARVESALALITDPDGRGPGRAPVRVGPFENFGAGVLNATGMSNQNSLGIAQLITTAESLRQGILNDATGPQTEGDALRALNSILAGRGDPAVIRQGFNDYLTAKRRTAAVRRRQMEELRAGGGQPAPAGGSVSVDAARAELIRRGVNPQ